MGLHSTVDRRKSVWRRVTSILGIASVVGAMAVAGSTAFADEGDPVAQQKVCAPSVDATAPYSPEMLEVVQIVGHDSDHDGYIIPQFEYTDGDDVDQTYPGLNWDATNQAIYDNDCVIPDSASDDESQQGDGGAKPLLSVRKTLVDPNQVIYVGDEFQYRIAYGCTTLTVACYNATLVDHLPAGIELVGDPQNLPVQADITWDSTSRELTFKFKDPIKNPAYPGAVGINGGDGGQFVITAKFTVVSEDGLVNKVDLSADGADTVFSEVPAVSHRKPAYGVSILKNFSEHSGLQGSDATTTAHLVATLDDPDSTNGDDPIRATSVTITDPSNSSTFFDDFDLTDADAITLPDLPDGVQAKVSVKTNGAYETVGTAPGASLRLPGDTDPAINAGDVTGVKVEFTCTAVADNDICSGGTITPGSVFKVDLALKLRKTVRSSVSTPPADVLPDSVTNWAHVDAAFVGGFTDEDSDDDTYTIESKSTQVDGSKSFNPASLEQGNVSPITVTVTGKNKGSVPASQMVITDPGLNRTDNHPFDLFQFDVFDALPVGVSVKIDVRDKTVTEDDGWVSLNSGSAYVGGATPSLPTSVENDNVIGLRWTFMNVPAQSDVTVNFSVKLRSGAAVANYTQANCVTIVMDTEYSTGASADNICAPFEVKRVALGADKTFSSPNSGVAQTGATTTVTLKGTNESAVDLTDFKLTDPGSGSSTGASNGVFTAFEVTGFGELKAPTGTKWKVEVYANGSWHALTKTYDAGSTPDVDDLPTVSGTKLTLADVKGVQYELENGATTPITAKNGSAVEGLTTTLTLKLRDGYSPTSQQTIRNCLDVAAAGGSANDCDDYTVRTLFGSGTTGGASKSYSPSSVVEGSDATTAVTLKGKNNASVAVNTLTLIDRSDSAFWTHFDFDDQVNILTLPTSTTSVDVYYWDTARTASDKWTVYATGVAATGVVSAPASGYNKENVGGLKFVWHGNFTAGLDNFMASFQAKLKSAEPAGSYRNCLDESFTTADNNAAVAGKTFEACQNITVTSRKIVERSKLFSPDTGVAGRTDANEDTIATITVKNTGVDALDSITVTDPDSSHSNFFTYFHLLGFGDVTLPDKVKVTITTYEGSTATSWGSYTDGQKVAEPSGFTRANVTKVEFKFESTETGGMILVSSSATMSVQMKLRLLDTAGTTDITNCFDTAAEGGTGSYAVSFTGDQCATYHSKALNPGASAKKSWNPNEGTLSDTSADPLSSTITIQGRNPGNVPVQALRIQDPQLTCSQSGCVTEPWQGKAFDYFDFTGFSSDASAIVWPDDVADRVDIEVYSNTLGGFVYLGAVVKGGTLPVAVDGHLQGAGADAGTSVALADVVGVRATFYSSTGALLPIITDQAKLGSVGFNVALRPTLRSDADVKTDPGIGKDQTVTNYSSAQVKYNGQWGTPSPAQADYKFHGGTVKVTPKKALVNAVPSRGVDPAQALQFNLLVSNDASSNRDLVAPIVRDKFDPAVLRYDATAEFPDGGFQFNQGTGPSLDLDDLTVSVDEVNGVVTFTFPSDYRLPPGKSASIDLVLVTRDGLSAGKDVKNTYGVSWGDHKTGTVTCTSGGTSDFVDGEYWCVNSVQTHIVSSSKLGTYKWIKGIDGLGFSKVDGVADSVECPEQNGYTRYPCIAHTVTSAEFDYQVDVTVTGNTPMRKVRLIDVLPHLNDTGVLDPAARGTQWTPTMSSDIDVMDGSHVLDDAKLTFYYSTLDTYKPSTAPIVSDGADWATNGWIEFPANFDTMAPEDQAALLASITSLGVDVDYTATTSGALPAGATFSLHWKMLAPDTAPGAGSVAWNSIARTGLAKGETDWLLPQEPRQVGIDLWNPTVTVDKTSVGSDGRTPADGTFGFTLTQVKDGNGDPVTNGPAWPRTISTQGGTGSATWALPDPVLVAGNTYRLAESSTGQSSAGSFQCVDTNAPEVPADSDQQGDAQDPGDQVDAVDTDTDKPKVTTFEYLGAGVVQFVPVNGARIVCSITNTKLPPPPPETPETPETTTGTTVPPTTSSTVGVSGESSSVNGADSTSSTNINVLPTSEDIAYTGVNALGMGALALLLLALGGGLLWLGAAGRRRKPQH